jgi:MoaA/NifB/PqqE/SkfB family radical SAM enzyme
MDINEDVLNDVINHLIDVSPKTLGISGGEFTLHPNFDTFLKKIIKKTNINLVLISNGTFVKDTEKYEKVRELMKSPKVLGIQITYGKKYHKNKDMILQNLDKFNKLGNNIGILEELDNLYPLGRACINHKELAQKTTENTKCINLYLFPRQMPYLSYSSMIEYLEIRSRFNVCKPAISPDGNIHCGESIFCHSIGSVNDNQELLMNKLKTQVPCNKCGLLKNLPDNAKQLLFP